MFAMCSDCDCIEHMASVVRLKGTYVPPPKPVEVEAKRKHTDMGLFSALMPKSKEEDVKVDKQNSFLKADNGKSSTESQSSLPLPPPAPLYVEVERQPSEASVATTASKVLTPMQIAEYSKEVIIHTFLAVHLVNGPKVAKKANEQATHPGYAVSWINCALLRTLLVYGCIE